MVGTVGSREAHDLPDSAHLCKVASALQAKQGFSVGGLGPRITGGILGGERVAVTAPGTPSVKNKRPTQSLEQLCLTHGLGLP